MPAAISHYLLAEEALSQYEKNDGIPVCRDAFFWGAQGPDFLFYHIPFFKGSLRVIGSRFHKADPARLLRAMCDFYDQKKTDLVRSYILGFVCHYSLDRIMHPFIYAQMRSIKELYPKRMDLFLHCKIETSLDVILLRFKKSCLPTEFSLKKTVPENRNVKEMMMKMYVFVIDRVFDKSVQEKSILWAMRYNQLISSIQYDRTGIKKIIAEVFERKSGKFLYSCFFRGISEDTDFDYANLQQKSWCWPPESGKPQTTSFLDLFQLSVAESVDFMQQIFDTDDMVKLTNQIPFS